MFLAAFSSRSKIRPHDGHTCVRTDKLFSTRLPQPLQSWDVYAGSTASARLPAHASEPQHSDALCRASGLPVATISAALVMMELKGLVRLAGPMTYASER